MSPLIRFGLSFLGFLLSCFAASAQDDLVEKYVSDKDKIPIIAHFASMSALAIFTNQGERTADAYSLPHFDVSPKREKCFPSYVANAPIRQNIRQPARTQSLLDLSGLLGGDIPTGISAEIKGNVTLVQETSGRFQNVEMESASFASMTRSFDASNCSELFSLIRKRTGNTQHIIIKDIYYLDGQIANVYNLKLTGVISAEAKGFLFRALKRLGISVTLTGNIAGEVQNLRVAKFEFAEGVPAAFRPLFIDNNDFNKIKEQYLDKGAGKILAGILFRGDELEVAFQGNGELFAKVTREARRDFLAELASAKDLILFDSSNPAHMDYLSFKGLTRAFGVKHGIDVNRRPFS